MNQKKTVIFHVSHQEQYYGEFNSSTQIRMLESYFKDVSHFSKFKFLYNGEPLNSDLRICDVFVSKNQTQELFLKVSLQNITLGGRDSVSNPELENTLNNKRNSLPHSNTIMHANNATEDLIKENYSIIARATDLETQVSSLRKENSDLMNIIQDLNEKLFMIQKAYDNSSLQNLNANRINDQIRNEYLELESAYNATREKLEKIQRRSVNNFSNRNSNAGNENKRKSSVNINPKLEESNLKYKRSSTMINSKDNLNTNNLNQEKISVVNFNNTTSSRFQIQRKTIAKNNFRSSVTNNKKENGAASNNNNNISNLNALSESSSNESFSKNNKGKPSAKAQSVENLKRINFKLLDFKPNKSQDKVYWNTILKFLMRSDHFILSLSNKEHFNIVANYRYDLTSAKLENINKTLHSNKKLYDIILEDQQLILSASANSALKILNNNKYLDIFSNENSYFEVVTLLPIYRLLFQITKILNDNMKMNINEFINSVKNYFKENSKKSGIGDLLKSLPKACDFSDVNMEKINEITLYYNLKVVDCGMLGKICKTTGIIAFFVKDALVYCGLDDSQDKKGKEVKEGKVKERITIIKDNLDIKDMKGKTEISLTYINDLLIKFNK